MTVRDALWRLIIQRNNEFASECKKCYCYRADKWKRKGIRKWFPEFFGKQQSVCLPLYGNDWDLVKEPRFAFLRLTLPREVIVRRVTQEELFPCLTNRLCYYRIETSHREKHFYVITLLPRTVPANGSQNTLQPHPRFDIYNCHHKSTIDRNGRLLLLLGSSLERIRREFRCFLTPKLKCSLAKLSTITLVNAFQHAISVTQADQECASFSC